MEPHATAEELPDQGLTLPPPNNSCASMALTDQQPAADDDSCSSGTSSGSAAGSSDRPYTVPAASGSSSNQALIWAPTGFKQQTYRPVQFRPHATGDGQSRATSWGNSSSNMASVTSAPEAPPWRVSGATEAFEASTGEKASRLSSRPTSDSVSLLLERATAPLPSRGAAMDEAGRQFPDTEELRPTSASCVEQEPCSGEGPQASCSSSAAPATASAAHQRSAVYPVEQQQQYEHQAADHWSCNGGSGSSGGSGGSSSPRPLQQSQLLPPHEAAELPAIAPKPSRGARLFAERKHRAAASAAADSSLPEESATSQPPPLDSHLTDDDDASSVASDTSSVGSSKLPPPAVPPKPRLKQPLSKTPSENEDHVDVNNGTGLLLQTRFSADESTAAALPANQTKDAAADSSGGSFTAMPPQSQEQPPVPRMRPRNAPPPAQPAGAAEVVRRKSLYEIVSTEGRREDKGLPRELQPQQKQLAAVAEERNSTSSHSGSFRQAGQSSRSHKPRPASDSQAPDSVLRHQRPVWWAATLPSRCTGDVLPASRDSAGLLAPTMTCSACGSSDASQATAAASSTAAGPGQNGQQTTDELTVAPIKSYDFPLRLPPTRSSFVTLLQRQRLENRSEAMFPSADPCTLSDDVGIRPTELCRSTATALDYSKCQQPACAGAGAEAGRDAGGVAEGNQAPVQPSLFADLFGCAGGSSSREPDAALPAAAAAAGSSSWTTESLDGSSRKRSGATAGGSIVPAHSRYRPAAGCMQTLLGSPNSERGRSLSEADRSGGADQRPTNSSDGSSCSGNPASVASPTSHRDWYKKMFKKLHSVDKQGEASFRILEAIKVYEERGSLNDTDINDNQISSMTYQMHEDPAQRMDEEEKYLGIERSSSLSGIGSVASHSAYIRLQQGGEVPLTGFRKQLPQVEKSVSTQSAATAKLEPQAAAPPEAGYYREQVLPDRKQREEQQTRRRQIMEQVEAAEKRRKAEKERLDQESRRHSDFFIPSAKVSITENRFDDFLASLPDKPPRAKAVTAQPGLRVRALFSFTAENSRELSFQKDDVICLLGQLDKHWLAGELNGSVGIFPCSYVVEVSQNVGAESVERSRDREGSARAKYNFKSEGGNELALRKGDFVTLIRRIDTNWYEVRSSSNRQGIVPVSYLDMHSESASTSAKGSTPTSIENRSAKTGNGSQGFTKTSVPLLYEAMYDYQRQYPDELDLRQGDVVRVVESCDDGWLFGTLMRTGTFGTLPGNYVKPVEPSQAMRLLQDGS